MAGKWQGAVAREIAKKGTKGALREEMGTAEGKNIPLAALKAKAAALSKKGEGDKKLSAADLKSMRRVQLALRFRGK